MSGSELNAARLVLAAADAERNAARAWAHDSGLPSPLDPGCPPPGEAAAIFFLAWPLCRELTRGLLADVLAGHVAAGAELTLPDPGYFGPLDFALASPSICRNVSRRPDPEDFEKLAVLRHVPSLEALTDHPGLRNRYRNRPPQGLHMAFSETCAMGCSMCPFFGTGMSPDDLKYYSAYRASRRGREYADPGIFARTLDLMRGHMDVAAVSIFGPGEPFQHPDTVRLMEICAERGLSMSFATNANHLKPDVLDALARLPVDAVIVSLDAVTEATYRQVKANGNFTRALAAVHGLGEAKGKGARFRLCLSFVRQSVNEHEEAEFVSRWAGKADEVVVTSSYHRGRPKYPPAWFPPRLLPCSHLDNGVHVLTDGECWICSAGTPNEFSLGNVLATGPEPILAKRDSIVRQRLEQESAGPACSGCRWWRQSERREVLRRGVPVRVERPYSYRVLS